MSSGLASVRPGWPSLKTMTPLAPAVPALRTLVAKGQVPRWMSAMLPAWKPVKSDCSQPLVEEEAGVGGRVRSTPWTGAVTSPAGDGWKA